MLSRFLALNICPHQKCMYLHSNYSYCTSEYVILSNILSINDMSLLSCELMQPCQQPLEEESEDNLYDLLRLVMDQPWTQVFDLHLA